ncbi:ABC transporter substrate-binding protein [Halopenitus sp. POP-27]|uniref:substrate-binding domain-containing protein n=1 Tax=Halopenitus sp. POP-27 TaxID=2994425 RepID=UPI00246993CF|nr:ABC transporter substrate-binding protein [Halopenitus sp. POP-27]
MDRRTFLKASGSATSVTVLAGCIGGNGGGNGNGNGGGNGNGNGGGNGNGNGGGNGGGSDDPIVIGAIQPLSGNFGPWGQAHQAGLEYGIQEINADGGVLDRDLEVVSNDTASDPSQADSYFREFVEQDDAVAITGAVSSDVGIRTSDTAQELEVPNFLHMAGADAAINDQRQHSFRVGLLPASNTMIAQSQLIEERGYENIGAIVGDYAWGRSIQAAMEEQFGDDVQIEVAPVGTSDFRPYLRSFDEDIEFLNATGHPPGNFTITQQAFDIGLDPDAISGSGFPPGVIQGALGDLAQEAYLHYHMSDYTTDEYVGVAEGFSEEFPDQDFDTHHSYGYVTAHLLAAAIEEAGEATSAAITETVREIEFETLYPEPLQYTNGGEPDGQVQIYSEFTTEAPDYAPDRDWGLSEVFRSDPLPAREY